MLNLGGDVESVYALSTHKSILEMEGEDSIVMLLKFRNGAMGNLIVTWGARRVGSVNLFVIYGDKGTIYEDSGNVGLIKEDSKELFQLEEDKGEGLSKGVEQFIDFILNDKEPPVSLEIAKRDLEVVMAAYKSIEKKEVILL